MNIKLFLLLTAAAVLLTAASVCTYGQSKTIVLVRHAEKAPARDDDKGDPDLSEEGKQRAERLARAVKKYKPHEIFVTDYKRTRQTAEPISRIRGRQIQTYDPQKQADLIPKIMAGPTDHFLIVGHSNTIPAFVNLLFKKEVFKQLPDSEYGVFYVVRIKKGIAKKIEVFPY